MKNIYWKLLRSNLRDYVLLIVVGVITVSLIYSTTALTAYLYQIVEGRVGTGTEIYGELGIFLISYILMVFLLVLVVLEYIRKRKYVYGVLNILGISEKQRDRFIAIEYVGIVACSITIGFLLGITEAKLLRKVIIKFLINGKSDVVFEESMIPFLLTFIISAVVFGVLFLVSNQLIACLGLEAILNPGKNTISYLTRRKISVIAAIVLEGVAISSYFGYWGMVNKLFPVVLGSLGLYILMIFWGEKILEKNRKKKRKYYKNITWTCSWYEQLHYYLKQAYLIAVLIMVMVAVSGISFLDNYPPVAIENYPYDIVWMANKEDVFFIHDLTEEYDLDVQMKECIRVTTPDFGEHMGISAFEYNQWTNKNLELSGEEIFIVYQRERKQRNELGLDYGRKKPRIHIGNAAYDLWIWETPKIMPGNKFDKDYKVAGEEDLVLTGVFESSALKKMRSGVWENIVVFSDEYFEKMQADAQGADLAVMINTTKSQYRQVLAEVKEYARNHSQIDFFSAEEENLIYEKEKIMKENQSQELVQLLSVGINSIILLFCGIFILTIKQKNDSKELCERYLFYEKMGMDNVKRKKNIYKESYIFILVAAWSGGVIGVLFAMIEIYRKHMEIKWLITYSVGIVGGYVSISAAFVVATWILARQDISILERGNQNG